MRKACGILTLIAASLLAAVPAAQEPVSELVVRGGWLFDSRAAQMRRNPGLRIRAGKLLEVGLAEAATAAPAARVIDLQNDEYILPGLFDLHAHYNVNLFGRLRRDEHEVNPIVFLANGVTSTFPAGEFDPQGMNQARRRIDRGEQVGPRIYNSGPYFGSARPDWNRDATTADIQREVDHWAAQGAAGFKAKGIAPAHLRALIERAHQHGLTVTGHLDSGYRDSVNPRDAILMGIARIEHFLGGNALPPSRSAYASLVHFSPEHPAFKDIVALFVRHRVFFDATLTAYGYYGHRQEGYDYWEDETRYFTAYVRDFQKQHPQRRFNEQFEKIYWVKRKTIKAFFDAGGLITLGTDYPSNGEYLAGFSAHRELDALVLSGIPPAAALSIGTWNGAVALRVSDRLGSIETGKLADLFVVRGNPLEDIRNTRNVRLVVKAGVVYDPRQLLPSVEGKLGPASAAEVEKW